jgi:diadenosine tetraphosphatase ApaH/serine/threonine PP2A family protein phosphatase
VQLFSPLWLHPIFSPAIGLAFPQKSACFPQPPTHFTLYTDVKGTKPVIAFLGDIHSNLQALQACLADARSLGASRYVFLGDYVGYGGDPDAVLTIVQAMVSVGAVAIKGNHDDMAGDFDRDMNYTAASAAKWTRNQLSEEQRTFLDALPLTITEDDRLYVHGDATAPAKWRYVTDCATARDSLDASEARLIFCGHVHQPQIYGLGRDDKMTKFVPEEDSEIPLFAPRRWHVVVPSVGQPRDGNTLAGYALFDPVKSEYIMRRVPYDIDAAATRILDVGLPSSLANRLYKGL